MSDQTIEGKLIVTDRIGIGPKQPEPETQLHISPTDKDGKIYLESGGNLLQVTVNSTIATIGTLSKCPLQLHADPKQSKSSGIYISNNGNVGIGTTSPSFNLDIQGIINATQFNKNGTLWKITDDDIDDNTISGTKIKDKTITEAKLDFTIGGSQWVSGSSGSISYSGGNVGIGKSPSFNLDVQGIINATQFNKNGQRWKMTDDDIDDNTISGKKIKDKTITEAKLAFSITPGGSQWKSGQSSGSIFYNNGNVGIGTDNPLSKLQVANGAIMPSVGKDQNAGIMFPKDPFGGGGDAAWIRYYARTGEATTLEIGTSDNREDHIALMSSGNVGIGTNNPQAKLHISTSQTTLRLQSTQPTQNGQRGGKARIEFWSDPQFSKTEWQQAVIESSDSDDLKRAFGGVLSFYVNRSSGDVNDNQIRPKKVMSMTENRVDVTGELYVNGKLVQSSSRYLKENITDFSTQEAIETLAGLNPVKFNYQEDKAKESTVGFIAEDVPELVATSERKGVCAMEIVAVLTKVIKELQKEVSVLKEKVNTLEVR